ncbi:MAG: T9SS type A sorting domain-containing protein, partial [Bacteroidota bacterium]
LQYNTEETFTIQAVATVLTNGESPTIICTSAMGTSLVEWNFPNSTDDQYSDAGIALNYVAGTPASCKQISTQGSAGSPTFSNAGIATRCATATGWDNGNGVKYWQVDLNSTGYTQLKLSSKQRSSGTGPKDWKIQYKLGAGGTWTDVSSGTISVADNWTTGVKTDLALPTACDNQASVYLRWVMTSNLQVTTGNVAAGGTSRIDDVKVTGVSGNALTTGSISGSPFCITSTMGISLTVPLTSSGTFNSGNIYTAQLSDENGSFGVPTTIGTLSSTSNSGNIFANIPAGTLDGTLYRIRVLSSDPYIAGTDNGVNLIVALNTPDVSNLSGSLGSLQATLNWINPAGCFDEVLIVGRATTNVNAGTPTGDGSAYTANLALGSGTAFLGGNVVYKGTTSGQTVTALTNGTTYFFKLFVRKGSNWSNGIEISVTPTTAVSGDYRSKASGNWSSITTWETFNGTTWVNAATFPDDKSKDVTIKSGTTVILDAGGTPPFNVKNLSVENGSKLFCNAQPPTTNVYISVYGNNLICDGIIGNGSTVDIIGFNIEGSNVTISGNGIFDCNRIRKNYNSSTGSPNTSVDVTNLIIAKDVNLRWNNSSGTQIYNAIAGYFNITLNAGSTLSLFVSSGFDGNAGINGTSGTGSGGGTWTINGTMNIPGTLYATTSSTVRNAKWIIGTGGVINCNQLDCSASGSAGHEIEILDGGKLNLNTNNGFFNFSSTNNVYDFQDGSTVEYSSPSGIQTVKATIPGIFEYSNLLISTTGGTKQLAGDITVKRDLIITGGILEANGKNISVGRNWENFGTNGFTEGAVGTVYCNGATAQTLSCPGGEDFFNIDFSFAGTKTLLTDINVASNLTINSASGSLIANTHNITLGGNWTNYGTAGFTEGAADVTFNGSTTQNLTCPGGENFYNLISNNTGGGINLLNNTSVFNQLSMNSGNILTNSNYLELGSSTSNLGILNYNTGYVVGKMRRWLNGLNSGYNSGLYPLGQDVSGSVKNRFYYIQYLQAPTAGGYLDINFNPVAMGSDGIPINGIPAIGTCATFDVVFTAQQGYWIATPEAGKLGDGNYTLAITGEDFNIVTDICELTLLKRVGAGNWQTPGTHLLPTGTGSLPTVSRSDLVGFSNFGFGGGYSNPLPVELRSFTAECAESGVEIKWSTATETNNNYFTIEKSADAKQWMTLAKIDGAGNSNQILNYQYADKKNLGGLVYYRLKQTDNNGNTEIFTPTSVNCSATSSDVFIYPNPFNEMITIQIGTSNENAQLRVYDQLGMKVKETLLNSKESDSGTFDLDLSELSRGVYFINFLSGSINKTEKIVKE